MRAKLPGHMRNNLLEYHRREMDHAMIEQAQALVAEASHGYLVSITHRIAAHVVIINMLEQQK